LIEFREREVVSSKEVAMANKQNFKPEEWTKILESTMLAGMAVSAAEPSGLLGALKEAVASSSTLAKAKSDPGANELVKAVVSDFETKEGRTAVQEALRQQLAGAKKPADVVERSLANLKEVSAILNAKAPQDAAGFKAWLQTMSENVAEASSEGGFLGIGGVKVSDAEKATLADISKALGMSA
jgi:membrane-bound lytic murein transglycosylase B